MPLESHLVTSSIACHGFRGPLLGYFRFLRLANQLGCTPSEDHLHEHMAKVWMFSPAHDHFYELVVIQFVQLYPYVIVQLGV